MKSKLTELLSSWPLLDSYVLFMFVYVPFMPFKLKYMVLYDVLNLAVVNSVDLSPMQYYLSDE